MFSRGLKPEETDLVQRVAAFVRDAAQRQGADVSHVFEVLRLSLEIGEKIKDPINPFVLTLIALFHNVGERLAGESPLSGFLGAAVAESLLRVTSVADVDRMRVARAVAVTGTHQVQAPESPEEKIVADAARLDRLGIMGVLRVLMAQSGGSPETLLDELGTSAAEYEGLYFQESKQIGESLYLQTKILTDSLEKAIRIRPIDLSQIKLP